MRQELEEELRRIAPTFLKELGSDPLFSCMAWGIECGEGWFNPLWHFCCYVENLNQLSIDGAIVAKQIKTKFGEMTVYWDMERKDGSPARGDEERGEDIKGLMAVAVRGLEDKCRHTCEICGSTEDIVEDRWLYICKKCKEKKESEKKWSDMNVTGASDSPSQVN